MRQGGAVLAVAVVVTVLGSSITGRQAAAQVPDLEHPEAAPLLSPSGVGARAGAQARPAAERPTVDRTSYRAHHSPRPFRLGSATMGPAWRYRLGDGFAQERTFHQDVSAAADDDDRWSFAGTAKWATLAVSAGAAAYGFSLNSQADEIFAQVEESCLDDPDRCEGRNPDGSFTDEELEGLYQDTLNKDRQARAALLVSQLALATSVVFFIVDLTDRSPPNVPYDPPVTLEVGPRPDGAIVLGARLRVGR